MTIPRFSIITIQFTILLLNYFQGKTLYLAFKMFTALTNINYRIRHYDEILNFFFLHGPSLL